MTRLLITGARGFVGQAVVQAAAAAGAIAVPLGRAEVDLGATDAPNRLARYLADIDAVIHIAASFGGDAAAHARDTVDATRHLLAAMTTARTPRLVLASSLSVYDVAAMSDGDVLNEATPLLSDAGQRDAYAAAKVAQEQMALASGLSTYILRPGAIYGPGRLWSAQLGFAKAGVVICPGGDIPVPAIHVDRVAAGMVHTALAGAAPVVNLIDPDPPLQRDWLTALGQRTIYVPRSAILAAGAVLGRGPAWQARFRPLRYDTTQARVLLNEPWAGFSKTLSEIKRQEIAA